MNNLKLLKTTLIFSLLLLIFAPQLYASISEASMPILDVEAYQDQNIPHLLGKLAYRIQKQPFNVISTIIFSLAVIHMFCTQLFHKLAYRIERKYRHQTVMTSNYADADANIPMPSSVLAEIIYFLGEPEVIFMIWVLPLMLALTHFFNGNIALQYVNSRSFNEPLFVVIVMILSATRPILHLASKIIGCIARLFGGSLKAWWLTTLTIAPLIGSLITEPGAITIAALLLGSKIYRYNLSSKFSYATLGLLFVNISVGGVLTHFAAPPVLMVAHVWNWNTPFMITTFGWKVIIGIVLSNFLYAYFLRNEFSKIQITYNIQSKGDKLNKNHSYEAPVPLWLTLVHVFMLSWTIYTENYPVVFVGSFLLFLGFHQASLPYQHELSLKPPILVGCFLAGLMVHGGLQGWWIDVVMDSFGSKALLLGTTVMTAFNDNAAITYLSTFNTKFTEPLKYAVLAGAVAGGGLTIMANAPNPAGFSLLKKYFPNGLSPLKLFWGAIIPTIIQVLVLMFF